jgi:hypothetical protein
MLVPVTADQAYAHLNGRPAQIPQRVTARPGFLTMPLGPDGQGGLRYQYKNRPVWAFTTPGCIRVPAPRPPARTSAASDRAAPCQSWRFIDAHTDQDLGGVG